MSLRDQPYLPLYIQDFLTDEKLIECSASATGVYIRLLCIMHKSETYGTILLKQKDKQNTEQIKNFASKLAKQMPYSFDEIHNGLTELLHENVIQIDGDYLQQKRMKKDGIISEARAKAGLVGGKSTQKRNKKFASKFAKAKSKANTENENEYEYENNNGNDIEKRKQEFAKKVSLYGTGNSKETLLAFFDYWTEHNENGKKLRFEMQPVFDITKRLATWNKNNKTFKNGKQSKHNSQSELDAAVEALFANSKV